MSNGEMKYQFNIFCGQQSYIHRTDSKAEAEKFSGVKLNNVNTVIPFLQELHLQVGQYDLPTARQPKKKEKIAGPTFKEQLLAKAKGKEKKKVAKMSEKQAQVALFNSLRRDK